MPIVPPARVGLTRLIDTQLGVFPEHAPYLEKRFADQPEAALAWDERIAGYILRIAGDDASIDTYCRDYQFLTQIVLEEEIHFRRHGDYRLKTFADALEQVYSNGPYMTRYMNGLLLSQLWWENHSAVLRFFHDNFLPGNPAGSAHLEIGPGHGLFLHLAAASPQIQQATGWDVSESSIEQVKHTFKALGELPAPQLELVNLFDAPDAQFNSVTFSEVLEHLEQPAEALAAIHRITAPGGRVFINAPINSPAPDHILSLIHI